MLLLNELIRKRVMACSVKKILYITANPIDDTRLQTDKEYTEIDTSIRRGTKRKYFELNPILAATLGDIAREITENSPPYYIVHFSGHGDKSTLMFANDQNEANNIDMSKLEVIFKHQKGNIELLVLNSCQSGNLAQQMSAFLACYAVGTTIDIIDKNAIFFSKGLYNSVANGESIETAIGKGRLLLEGEFSELKKSISIWKNGKRLLGLTNNASEQDLYDLGILQDKN